MAEFLTSGVVALGGAFAGAYAAFHLERCERKKRAEESEKIAGNNALFVLSKFVNDLIAVRRQFIDPHRDDPGRAFTIRASLQFPNPTLRIDAQSLAFLIADAEPQLLMNVLIHEDKFTTCISAINARSKMHLEDVQPRLEAAGLRFDQPISGEEVLKALGPRITKSMQDTTEEMISLLDDTVSSTCAIAEALYDHMKLKYPKNDFITLDTNRSQEN